MLGSCSSKRQQMSTRFQHPQALAPDVLARHIIIPLLAHERQAIRGVRHNRVNTRVRKRWKHLKAVAMQKEGRGCHSPHVAVNPDRCKQ